MRFSLGVCAALAAALSFNAFGQGPTGVPVIAAPAQAIALAYERSPALRSAAASRQGVDADGLAAPIRPNPEASLTVENFGGIGGVGAYRGARSVETTLGFSQRLELGGKRPARIDLASRNSAVADLELGAARLDLTRDVMLALVEAEATARNARLEQDRVRLAAETARIASARVDAGREPLLQSRRSELNLATTNIAVERAKREAATALRNLAVVIGLPRVELAVRQPWYDEITGASRSTPQGDPIHRISANPDFKKIDIVVAQQEANVRLQHANGVPDVTVQGGMRRFQEGRETAFVASASIPLPFNDRNQAGIARAQADLRRAEAEAARARETLIASLLTAEQGLDEAQRAVQMLRRKAIPAAEQGARLASNGFAEGKFTYLEASDAQRALSDVRSQLNELMREFHTRRAEVQRLRGLGPDLATSGASVR